MLQRLTFYMRKAGCCSSVAQPQKYVKHSEKNCLESQVVQTKKSLREAQNNRTLYPEVAKNNTIP